MPPTADHADRSGRRAEAVASGAVGLAAVLAGKLPVRGRTIAVVCSGGNVDPATYGRALAML